eukprot:3618657-Prymnesium_polylepis.1
MLGALRQRGQQRLCSLWKACADGGMRPCTGSTAATRWAAVPDLRRIGEQDLVQWRRGAQCRVGRVGKGGAAVPRGGVRLVARRPSPLPKAAEAPTPGCRIFHPPLEVLGKLQHGGDGEEGALVVVADVEAAPFAHEPSKEWMAAPG